MARKRFAVALIVPPPAAIEIDALRQALGDRQLGRIDAHVTIVPPINLDDDGLIEALIVVERAASMCPPCSLTLGPVETFSESAPTRFLRVEPWSPVEQLYAACWTGPFERPERRSFVPHVTIDIDGGPTEGPDPAVDLLAGFTTACTIDHVTLLEHRDERDDGSGRGWEPYRRFRLAGPPR